MICALHVERYTERGTRGVGNGGDVGSFDMRGLGTALHLFLAGLPRSKCGDHREGCSLKSSEDSPHRSHASRSRLGVWLEVRVPSVRPVLVTREDLGVNFHMARHVPDEAGELAGDGDADFVLRQLFSRRKTAPTLGEARLRFPGDVADDFRLPFLPDLEASRDLSFEAIIPRGLHQDTSSRVVSVAEMGDLTRFAHPRALIAYLGLVPSEFFSGKSRGLGETTESGNNQRFHHRIHPPLFTLHSQRLSDPFDLFAGLLRTQSIFVKGRLLRGMFEVDRGQVPISNRHRDRLSVDIQSYIGSDRFFHGLSPDGFGRKIPSGTLHVARRTHPRNPRYRRQTTSSSFNTYRTPVRMCGP
jgi:hypothetical protein